MFKLVPDSMNYEQRSELRKECSRFLRFSYLVDFQALESLRVIYRQSVKDILNEFQQLISVKEDIIVKEKNQRPVSKQRYSNNNNNNNYYYYSIKNFSLVYKKNYL